MEKLIMHIICVICWAFCAITIDDKFIRITCLITTIAWSMCVGNDIALMRM